MQSSRRLGYRGALRLCRLAAGVALAMVGGATARAQCLGYSVTPGPGTFTPGTSDIGNHCDDCVTSIALPFNVNFYGTPYNSANISSNGTLQFVSSSTAYANVCWPATGVQTGFGPTIFPFWDDLYTSGTAAGQGVFTDLSGAPGSQVFVIEWRTNYCCNTAAPINDFEVKFYENQSYIDIVYSTPMSDRSSATIGVQDGNGQFVQYSCNVAGPTSGVSLRVNCLSSSTAGACCNPTAGTCAITNQGECSPASNFQGVGSSCPGTCPGQGACCDVTSGACTLTGATGCASPNTFQGVGSVCATGVCNGACCNDTTAACTLTGPMGCFVGTFQGVGTACSTGLCPTQACCNASTGACTVVGPSGSCPGGTTTQGPGTSCAVNPCPQPPPPANDDCFAVTSASMPVIPGSGGTVSGITVNATTDGAGSCTHGYKDVYFVFTPATTTAWTFSTCATSPSFDTMISVHTGCPADTTTQVAGGCNDDSCGLLSQVTVGGLSAGTQYVVRVGNYSSAATGGLFTLDVTPALLGACCNATTGACTSSTTGAAGCASGTAYQGDNTACGSSPYAICGQGACCNPGTGACSLSTAAGCVSPSSFQSAGTSCTVNPCPQPPTGACCNTSSGACTQVFAANCNTSTSTYSGDNTVCDPSGFCTASGSCCSSLGTCTLRYGAPCAAGLTSNSATTCSPTLCPSTGPSFCENFDGGPVGGLPNNWSTSSTGAGIPWAIDSTQSNSAPNAVFTNDPDTVSSQFLVLPAVTAGSSGALTLDFVSYFDTEATFDGFVVEYSTDGGNSWTDVAVGGSWVLNGYNQAAISVNFNSPIAGRPAFSGVFTSWIEHIASIPASSGQQVIIRFQMASDSSVTHTGVWLDNICVGGIQGAGGTGVCCRGSTCNSTVTQANCTGNGLAGASFASSASACNAGGSTSTPCCYADYNKVNSISVQDIFDFLNDWFAGSPYANVGHDGTPGALSVQNIFDFLNAWFAGGCS